MFEHLDFALHLTVVLDPSAMGQEGGDVWGQVRLLRQMGLSAVVDLRGWRSTDCSLLQHWHGTS